MNIVTVAYMSACFGFFLGMCVSAIFRAGQRVEEAQQGGGYQPDRRRSDGVDNPPPRRP